MRFALTLALRVSHRFESEPSVTDRDSLPDLKN